MLASYQLRNLHTFQSILGSERADESSIHSTLMSVLIFACCRAICLPIVSSSSEPSWNADIAACGFLTCLVAGLAGSCRPYFTPLLPSSMAAEVSTTVCQSFCGDLVLHPLYHRRVVGAKLDRYAKTALGRCFANGVGARAEHYNLCLQFMFLISGFIHSRTDTHLCK